MKVPRSKGKTATCMFPEIQESMATTIIITLSDMMAVITGVSMCMFLSITPGSTQPIVLVSTTASMYLIPGLAPGLTTTVGLLVPTTVAFTSITTDPMVHGEVLTTS